MKLCSYLALFLLLERSLGIIRFSFITVDKGVMILGVEVGARIYVASSDDEAWLKTIQINNDAEQKTALDILNMGNNPDGTTVGWKIKGTITLNSSNTGMDAEKLSGFLYFTTFTQEQDPSFLVYTVDRQIAVSHENSDLTLVFLNQNLLNRDENSPLYVPTMSSHVSGFTTAQSTETSVYWNEPMETYKNPEADASQQQKIFSNPLQTIAWKFFDTVEPFNIFNEVWYIRSNGRIRFTVEPKWIDPNGFTTSGLTTTGLVMCSYAPENLTINMMSNQGNTASTGIMVLYNLINPIVFTMDGFQYKITSKNEIRNEREGNWNAKGSTKFSIQSNVSVAGRYAVQYFQIDGLALPTNTPTPASMTTPTTMETTTKTAPIKLPIFLLFLFILLH